MLGEFRFGEAIAGRYDGGNPVQQARCGSAGVQLLVQLRVGVAVEALERLGS